MIAPERDSAGGDGGVEIDLLDHGGGTIFLQDVDIAAIDHTDFIF